MDETARLLFVDDEENILKSQRRFITNEDSEANEELRKGMIVAHEVRSGTGLVLLGSGEYLDEGKIQTLKRFYAIDPSSGGIAVLFRNQG